MISTVIFDLDGTLVQTEKLKALSYARAAVELCASALTETEVVDAFADVVGLSRREVAIYLMKKFALTEKSAARMPEFGVTAPWQAFVQVRLRHYERLIADPQTILDNQWPHNMALLEASRSACNYVALATMSYCEQAGRVLSILGLSDAFDFVATRDDVEYGKPNPEIYLLVANELGVDPSDCLVIEDSPSGARAGVNAGMHVLAVATPFTKRRLYEDGAVSAENIIDDPADVMAAAARIIAASNQ